MWTSRSSNHASEHHSPLSNQPHVVITAALGLRSPYANHPVAAALDVQREPAQTPFLNRAARAHGTGTARQRLTLDTALIGPHPPAAGRVRRDEVDIGAVWSQRRVKSERPPAVHDVHLIHIVHQDDQMRD